MLFSQPQPVFLVVPNAIVTQPSAMCAQLVFIEKQTRLVKVTYFFKKSKKNHSSVY